MVWLVNACSWNCTVDGSEIPNNHLGCIKILVDSWDRLHIKWCRISSINSMSWYDFLFLWNEKVPMFLRLDVEVFEPSISVGPQSGDLGISILGEWAPTVSKWLVKWVTSAIFNNYRLTQSLGDLYTITIVTNHVCTSWDHPPLVWNGHCNNEASSCWIRRSIPNVTPTDQSGVTGVKYHVITTWGGGPCGGRAATKALWHSIELFG